MKNEDKQQIFNEANIMKKLNHPNIILFKEVINDVKLDYVYIVMEYADDGDLNKKIKSREKMKCSENDKLFPEEVILKYFIQICKGLNYIHSKNIIHRDIKSQNIFLMKNGTIKIGDFGIAKTLTKTISNAMTVIGTPYYFSPEIINGEPYNYKSDIWSLGVLLYEMCTLKLPFDSSNLAQLSIKIIRGNYEPISKKYSKDLHLLIKKMLNVNKNLRPDIKNILQFSFVKCLNNNMRSTNSIIRKNRNKSCINISQNVKTKQQNNLLGNVSKYNLRNKNTNSTNYLVYNRVSPNKLKNKSFVMQKHSSNINENQIENKFENKIQNKISSNNKINKDIQKNKKSQQENNDLFYKLVLSNKDEIINRSNAFEENFKNKSILFDKEKSLEFTNNNENKTNEEEKIEKDIDSNDDEAWNYNIVHQNNNTIKMFTVTEEELRKTNSQLSKEELEISNFDIKENNIINDNDNLLNYPKNENDDFIIINNDDNKNIKKKKELTFEESIIEKIGENIYLNIKNFFIEKKNMEFIVDYNFDDFSKELNKYLKSKNFNEIEIRNANYYIFDIFFSIINK